MKHTRVVLLALVLMLAVVLAGCVQRASTPPPTGGGTEEAKSPQTGATSDLMSELEKAATQTLMAMQATQQPPASPVPAGETPAAGTPAGETPAGGQTPQAEQPTAAVQPANTPVPVPSATPGRPASYTLQKGEHPYCIARRFDVNPLDMLQLSGLNSGSTYYPGLVLRIPQGGGGFPSARSLKSHPTNYNVTSGDSIYSIACEFGDVDPNAIVIANNLQAPYTLTAGQTIYIP